MGARSIISKRAQREILPSPTKKLAPRQWNKGPGACWTVSGWSQWKGAGLHLQEVKKKNQISPTSSFCLEPSLLRPNNENLHSTLLNTVMPFCLNNARACA